LSNVISRHFTPRERDVIIKSDSPEKQFAIKTSNDPGTMISTKPVPSNAHISIRDNFDLDSNIIEESDSCPEKHFTLKTSIDPGTVISTKPVPRNAFRSIRDNFDPDSNITHKSSSHPKAQPS
jgi:hypothetical protein